MILPPKGRIVRSELSASDYGKPMSRCERGADMFDGAYDREGIRILADALNDALLDIEAKAQRRLTENEKADFAERITQRLLDAFDMGERTAEGLRRVAATAIEPSKA